MDNPSHNCGHGRGQDQAPSTPPPPPAVDVVIPLFNEEENIDALLGRVVDVFAAHSRQWRGKLILVDDGSKDNTAAKVEPWLQKHPQISFLRLNRNYGQHAAIIAGFGKCRGDIVVTLDADLQNPPEEIPALVDKILEGHDVVGGVRQVRKDTLFRKIASKAMNFCVRRITGVPMADFGCMLRAYRAEIVKAILQCSERFIYIPVLANSFARSAVEIPVKHAERAAGISKYNVWKLFTLFFDILTGSTFMPLRALAFGGVLLSAASIAFGVMLIILRIILGSEWAAFGVFTLFGGLFFLVGVQFLALGILGEYVCRIGMDVRNRPRYLVASWREAGSAPPQPPQQ